MVILNSLELLTKNLTALVVRCSVQPEFEYYHSLLLTHGEGLIEEFKNTLLTAKYDDASRVLEFGSKTYFNTTIKFVSDGQGNVTLTLPSTMSMTDDGFGNVTIVGARFVDDGNGNIIMS